MNYELTMSMYYSVSNFRMRLILNQCTDQSNPIRSQIVSQWCYWQPFNVVCPFKKNFDVKLEKSLTKMSDILQNRVRYICTAAISIFNRLFLHSCRHLVTEHVQLQLSDTAVLLNCRTGMSDISGNDLVSLSVYFPLLQKLRGNQQEGRGKNHVLYPRQGEPAARGANHALGPYSICYLSGFCVKT